ncbi:MAG TPA: hypothetical protein VKT77_23695 [Chthonomonadaceae bacterium]|nr:hypothetical protein [Chthonomonadaceae bacterium]
MVEMYTPSDDGPADRMLRALPATADRTLNVPTRINGSCAGSVGLPPPMVGRATGHAADDPPAAGPASTNRLATNHRATGPTGTVRAADHPATGRAATNHAAPAAGATDHAPTDPLATGRAATRNADLDFVTKDLTAAGCYKTDIGTAERGAAGLATSNHAGTDAGSAGHAATGRAKSDVADTEVRATSQAAMPRAAALKPATRTSLLGHLAVVSLVLLLTAVAAIGAAAQAAAPKLSLAAAAAATELPTPPWGPYSSLHAGPCYLQSRKLSPLIAFPIIVGQERDEVLPIGTRTVDGKPRRLPERVTLLRRAGGLSPADASGDAKGAAALGRIVDADSYGYLTTAHIGFPGAPLAQDVAHRRDATGAALPDTPWPAASATVSWSAAFADNGAEGLVIKVTVTNPGATAQRFFVDLCGGLDRPDPLFAAEDLTVETDPEARGVTFRHKKLDTTFAIAGTQGDFTTRSYAVSATIFSPAANACPRDPAGAPLPPESPAPAWALTRLSGITVAPGESQMVLFAVGLGKDADGALLSARTLLTAAGEHKGGEDLFALAAKAHGQVRFKSGSVAMDRLVAQSLVNIPIHDSRRVGVASRERSPFYQPGIGGWMALGWEEPRPDWSAAQLNAWLLSQTDAHKTISRTVTVPPTDIFVLWDLFQHTHDTGMLGKLYPYAVWRFREFLESGRERDGDWVFTWPRAKPGSAANAAASREGPAYYAPDYSAYVLLSARVLLACSKALDRPGEEQQPFIMAIDNAWAAMTKDLWDPKRGQFVPRPAAPSATTAAAQPDAPGDDRIESLLPFIAGKEALTIEQDADLRRQLADESTFLSPFGLRGRSAKSVDYRPTGADSGVGFGVQWLIWKSLLDRGDAAHAADLAGRVLTAYERAAEASGGCPEWLNGDTGAPLGRLDFAGDSCALVALHEAYHRTGAVSCGWDVNLLEGQYDTAADSLRVTFRSLVDEPKGVLLCKMATPGAKYRATGGVTADLTTDAYGVIALPLPRDKTTQQVKIVPASVN